MAGFFSENPELSDRAALGRLSGEAQGSTPVVITYLTPTVARVQLTCAPTPFFALDDLELTIYRRNLRVNVKGMSARGSLDPQELELRFDNPRSKHVES
jgi:hypothetical protein